VPVRHTGDDSAGASPLGDQGLPTQANAADGYARNSGILAHVPSAPGRNWCRPVGWPPTPLLSGFGKFSQKIFATNF